MRRQVVLVVAVLLSFAGRSAWGETRYTVTDLGAPIGGSESHASGINASGQVVGGSWMNHLNKYHAFLYDNGVMTDLGMPSGYSASEALGINANRQVVMNAKTGSGGPHAFLYSNGTMTGLGALGGLYSSAQGINASGQVVGWANASNGYQHAFLYSTGIGMTDLNTLLNGSSSLATGINDSGQVVGQVSSTNGNHAFLYSTINGTKTDLGAGLAYGINDSGQVVGQNGSSHAFFYSSGTMIDLGAGLTYGINDSGWAVGYSDVQSGNSYNRHAFLYSDGAMTDLNTLIATSGWTLTTATAINDFGYIIGNGHNPQGQETAFLLTPVPEPSTFVLLGIGAAGLFAWRRRQAA